MLLPVVYANPRYLEHLVSKRSTSSMTIISTTIVIKSYVTYTIIPDRIVGTKTHAIVMACQTLPQDLIWADDDAGGAGN